MNKRIYPIAVAALALALAGCGGSGSSNHNPPAGGVTGTTVTLTADSTSPTAIDAAPGTEVAASFDFNGVADDDAVPGGESIPAGSDILLIPSDLPIDIESNDTAAIKTASTVKPAMIGTKDKPAFNGLTAGEVYLINGAQVIDTGLHLAGKKIVGHDGHLFKHYAFAYPSEGNSRYLSLVIAGPFHLGKRPRLDISDFIEYNFELSKDGTLGAGRQNTWPTGAIFALPANGGTTFQSILRVNLGHLNTSTAVPASLQVLWPGVAKSQTRNTGGGLTTLYDETASGQHDAVPSTGITSSTLTIQK